MISLANRKRGCLKPLQILKNSVFIQLFRQPLLVLSQLTNSTNYSSYEISIIRLACTLASSFLGKLIVNTPFS